MAEIRVLGDAPCGLSLGGYDCDVELWMPILRSECRLRFRSRTSLILFWGVGPVINFVSYDTIIYARGIISLVGDTSRCYACVFWIGCHVLAQSQRLD